MHDDRLSPIGIGCALVGAVFFILAIDRTDRDVAMLVAAFAVGLAGFAPFAAAARWIAPIPAVIATYLLWHTTARLPSVIGLVFLVVCALVATHGRMRAGSVPRAVVSE